MRVTTGCPSPRRHTSGWSRNILPMFWRRRSITNFKRNFWLRSARRKICPRSHCPSASNSTCLRQQGNVIGILITNNEIRTSPLRSTVLENIEYRPRLCGPLPHLFTQILGPQNSASNRNEYQEHFLGVKAAGA